MGIFGFWQKETGAKSVAMAVTQQVSFGFFCVVHFRCQVSRTLLQYTSRDISFQCFTVLWSHHFPNLHNTKYNRLYTERRYSKKCHSFLFWKAFQTGWNYFFTSWALQGQQVHIILAFKLPLAVLWFASVVPLPLCYSLVCCVQSLQPQPMLQQLPHHC